jgi:hypothetical protein
MKRIGALILGFGYMVLLIEAIRLAVAWSNGEIDDFGVAEWLLLGSLPVLAWVWWHYLSPFGRDRGQCLLPDTERPQQKH